MTRLSVWKKLLLAAAGLCMASIAVAQGSGAGDFPSKPIRVILPYPGGNLPDTVARIVTGHMSKALGQTFIIDARPSGGGIVAAEAVARSPADGHTLLFADPQIWAIDALVYKSLSFDPVADFVPLSVIGDSPLMLVVGRAFPTSARWPDIVAHLKANPGKYNYASNGIGSIAHFTMESLKAKAGIELLHVPYRGAPEFLPALRQGDVSFVITSPAGFPAAEAAGARAVAATTPKRLAGFSALPTFDELGVHGFDFSGPFGLLAPNGTPIAITEKLAAAIRSAVADPEVNRRLSELGVVTVGSSSAEFAAWIKADISKFTEANKSARVEVQ